MLALLQDLEEWGGEVEVDLDEGGGGFRGGGRGR